MSSPAETPGPFANSASCVTTQAVPRVVVDTNTALDALLFGDAGVQLLMQAITTGAARWTACPRMREEFARTLGYSQLARWSPDAGRLLAAFDECVQFVDDPTASSPLLRCKDRDDQVFIDLAIGVGARWLVTHDKAVLALARRARPLGLQIVKPGNWRL